MGKNVASQTAGLPLKPHQFQPQDFSPCDTSLSDVPPNLELPCPRVPLAISHFQHKIPQQESFLPKSSTCRGLPRTSSSPDRNGLESQGPGLQARRRRSTASGTVAHGACLMPQTPALLSLLSSTGAMGPEDVSGWYELPLGERCEPITEF